MKIVHHYVTSVLGSLIILGGIIFNHSSYGEYIGAPIQIGLQIINSYSGWINFSTGQNIIYTGDNWWTNSDVVYIDIGASTGTDFFMSGTVTSTTGWVDNNYDISIPIHLSLGDGSKNIRSRFIRAATEEYTSNELSLMLDETDPTPALPITPIINPTNENILFSWTDSSDNGIGLSHYKIHISTNSGFLGEMTTLLLDNNFTIDSNILPQSNLFRYIESIDYLGNSSNSTLSIFNNNIDDNSANNTGLSRAGGGGGSIISHFRPIIKKPLIQSWHLPELIDWIIDHNTSSGEYYDVNELIDLLTGTDNSYMNKQTKLQLTKKISSPNYYINKLKQGNIILSSGDFNPYVYGDNFIHTIIIKREAQQKKTTLWLILHEVIKKVTKYLTN